MKTRVHGDYHLGQVLRADDDFIILDFEGEPARSVEERREKRSPLKDVVGMLRSFDYAAYAALFEYTRSRPEDFDRLEPWARLWQAWTSAAFWREYRAVSGKAPYLPDDPAALGLLLDAYTLDKILYELLYELNNRPDWVCIPLQGIESLIEREQAVDAGRRPRPLPRRARTSGPCPGRTRRPRPRRSPARGSATSTCTCSPRGPTIVLTRSSARHVDELNGTRGHRLRRLGAERRRRLGHRRLQRLGPRCAPDASPGPGGIWERFIPGVEPGARYKYSIAPRGGGPRVEKADPYGFHADRRPETASKVWDLSRYQWGDRDWMSARRKAQAPDAPDLDLRGPSRLLDARARGRQPLADLSRARPQARPITPTRWDSRTSSCCRSPSIPSTAHGATSRSATMPRPAGSARPTTSGSWSTRCTSGESA